MLSGEDEERVSHKIDITVKNKQLAKITAPPITHIFRIRFADLIFRLGCILLN